MNRIRHSMQSKKSTAVILHIIFLCITLCGISMMYLNSNYGKGLLWITEESYEDTPVFTQQLQKDLDQIFYYVQYRDVFETSGKIDLSKPILRVSSGPGGDTIYTLDEIIRYAKTRGYYLNDKFKITGDPTEPSDEDLEEVMVDWRAYNPALKYSEPGDAYLTMEELSLEVLTYLGDYYTAYYSLFENTTNLKFEIMYQSKKSSRSTVYSNLSEADTLEYLKEVGKYIYVTGDSIMIDSNISVLPKKLSPSLESNNPYDSNQYHMILSIDTSYPSLDAYAIESQNYQNMRTRYIIGLICLVTGFVSCLITLSYLVLVSGHGSKGQSRYDEEITLHYYDHITTESGIFFCTIGTLFALFLGETIGYPLLHLVIQKSSWYYAHRLLQAIIIYGGFLFGAFSLLRRYKARTLWQNSLFKRIVISSQVYFTYHSFTVRLAASYGVYLLCNTVLISTIMFLIFHRDTMINKILLATMILLWIIWNILIFHRLYVTAIQQDKIGQAIQNISLGDTSFKIDLTDFSGKERELADGINNIGSGMETALQEQVKSERLKADLITNVSHDIKTPLTSIINYVDLIKREQIQDEKIQGYLEVLEQKSQRLKTLTEDLVEASKASSGNLKLEIADIDLVELVQQTTGEFGEKFAIRHLELVTELPEEVIIIEGDGRRLWRVLENLYNNAFKYSMAHSRIYVNIARTEDQVCFTIKNVSESPLNINAEELTNRFVRGDVARATEGSGLGLSIAKSLTEIQGGTFQIFIDGDLFKVLVTLPIKKSNT